MRKPRTFSTEFKRKVVEELFSEMSGSASLCRKYNISSGLLYHWKKQCTKGKFNNEPTQEQAMLDRINKLEQILA